MPPGAVRVGEKGAVPSILDFTFSKLDALSLAFFTEKIGASF